VFSLKGMSIKFFSWILPLCDFVLHFIPEYPGFVVQVFKINHNGARRLTQNVTKNFLTASWGEANKTDNVP
jgi:hypothetical protein